MLRVNTFISDAISDAKTGIALDVDGVCRWRTALGRAHKKISHRF